MPAIIRSQWPIRIWTFVRRLSFKANPNAVVIAAAVRTSNSIQWDKEEHQLAGMVIDDLVKRTLVPRDAFKKLIVCTSSNVLGNFSLNSVAKNLGLKGCKTHFIQDESCSVSGLKMSLESLQNGEGDWIILGDTRSNIMEEQQNILQSELMTAVPVRKSTSAKNESNPNSVKCPSAAALALTTAQTAERLQLQPLAVVREFFIEENNAQALYRLSGTQPIQLHDVHSWELVLPNSKEHLELLAELNVNDVRTHDHKQITASHLLTHTVHALPAGSLGCVVMESNDGRCLLLVLEKIIPQSGPAESIPELTLYTKEPCPLCDELVAQLVANFSGEVDLKKVFIDRKENVRFLRLFRYDIPVLFLNGQFLCMHRLDNQLLRERLTALKMGKAKENMAKHS